MAWELHFLFFLLLSEGKERPLSNQPQEAVLVPELKSLVLPTAHWLEERMKTLLDIVVDNDGYSFSLSVRPEGEAQYERLLFLRWMLHHLEAGTLHDTFRLPYAPVRITRAPRLILVSYFERDPQVHGVEWPDRLVLYVCPAETALEQVAHHQGAGEDRVLSVRGVWLDEEGRLLVRTDTGYPIEVPGMANLVLEQPQQDSWSSRLRHPAPDLFDLSTELGWPSLLQLMIRRAKRSQPTR